MLAMKTMRGLPGCVLASVLLAGALTGCAHAPAVPEGRVTEEGFAWIASMPDGAWLRIHTLNGRIDVEATTGDRVEVRALEEGRDGRAPGFRYEVVRDGKDVTICAIPAEGVECRSNGIRNPGGVRRSIRGAAHLTVLLPYGVKLEAQSSNGSIVVQDVTAEVNAITGNGSVTISRTGAKVRASSGNGHIRVVDAAGPVGAVSGNGNISVSTSEGPVEVITGSGNVQVRMLTIWGDDDLNLRTGSGHVVVRLPAEFAGQIDARGYTRFDSDFPLIVQGSQRWGRIRGTIGDARRRINIVTGTGRVELRREE